ncbi:MAG: hypothetical protein WCO15_05160 [Actinomycetota bacterium]
MSAIKARRRRRMVTALVLGLVGVVALPAGLVVGTNSLLNTSGGKSVDQTPALQIPTTPAGLLVGVNESDEVTMMALLAIAPGAKGGTIVSIPVGANAEIPKSGEIHRVADTYKTSGFDAFVIDVEGLLNVTFSVAAKVSTAELAAMLAPIGNQSVLIEKEVINTELDGTDAVVLSAGQQTLTPMQIAQGLMARKTGALESDRLSRIKLLWETVAKARPKMSESPSITTETTRSTTLVIPTDIASFFSAVISGPVQNWQLTGTFVSEPQRNPGPRDLYDLDGGEIIMVMASVVPSSVTAGSAMISFLIDSPFTDARITRQAVLRLAYIGANVIVVREVPGAPAAHTVIKYNDEIVRSDLELFTTLFGPIEFNKTDERVEGIDAQLVLGEDFRAFIGSAQGATISTTTTLVGS